jgi:POTRA domain, FtsQ-type
MKRKTTNRRNAHRNVLEVRVMSPRIAWLGFMGFLGVLTKIACVLAVLAGIGWGVWRGVRHAFYQNPDFSLKVIDLNANPVIDEFGVAGAIGIDLAACPSLFEIDVKNAGDKLRTLPGILDARVERHLPGSLVVRIIPRTAKAWISCPGEGITDVRRAGAMLVDQLGVAYPCPELQVKSAATLPVIELPASADHAIATGEKITHAELRHCFLLLDSARAADPDAIHWIETLRQVNEWSLELRTRGGTRATFGLGDHPRQIESLRAALDHAAGEGYVIDTINLIPKYNIPVTVRDESSPRAILVKPPASADPVETRRERDLGTLLNRN